MAANFRASARPRHAVLHRTVGALHLSATAIPAAIHPMAIPPLFLLYYVVGSLYYLVGSIGVSLAS